jgi:hypothetical protein
VLRLLTVAGSDGARDGHVTYHAEALEPPRGGLAPAQPALRDLVFGDHPLRLPWARPDGLRDLLTWAADQVELAGRPRQRKTWNLACLFRLPAAGGPAWLKAVPGFAAAEPAALAAFAAADPALVPAVLASAPGRLVLADVAGTDSWEAPVPVVTEAVTRLVTAQARIAARPGPVPDRRPEILAAAVRGLLDGPAVPELSDSERQAARDLLPRWERLAGCGLPDTLVHGDFHPGNWRHDADGKPVILDFADAHWGNPVLDGLRAIDFLPAGRRPAAAAAWTSAWAAAVPSSRPTDALRVAEPLAHLAYAVRYQEFLDNIEPSERVYHQGDPAAAIRHALAAARRQDEA